MVEVEFNRRHRFRCASYDIACHLLADMFRGLMIECFEVHKKSATLRWPR